MHKKCWPSVVDYYKNRSVFVTGATGFIGKVLVEKLLRCTGIDNIYLLIRSSKNASSEERLQQLLQSSIFNNHKIRDNEFLKKLILIPGDITQNGLGISNGNLQMLSEKVSIVFHAAASIKFNMRMNVALKQNLEGTRNVLSLSKSFKNLSSMVYVSTAYSNAERQNLPIEEDIYPARFDSNSSLKFFDELEQLGILDTITPKLLNGKPNTYVFSKHLAENLVLRKGYLEWNLPICIVRPSIVGPIYNDPVELRGWVDNMNGVMPMCYAIGHGFTFVSPGGQNNIFDVIPVDYVVKIIILAAWKNANNTKSNNDNNTAAAECKEIGVFNKADKCTVYNACVYQFTQITHGKFVEYVGKSVNNTPFSTLVLPPSTKLTEGSWWSPLNSVVVGVPCMVMDLFAKLNGKKSRYQLTFKANERGARQSAFFRRTQYEFKSSNVLKLRSQIPASEKEIFDLNMEDINWSEYIQNGVLGLRRYYLKDQDSTIPAAVKNLKRIRRLYSIIGISVPLVVALPLSIFFSF